MKTKKCPVCDWETKDGGIKVMVEGKEIAVCCDDCGKKVKLTPTKYVGATDYPRFLLTLTRVRR
jgi:ribosome-binding protein aMBF1 (putative translation factor)